MMTACMPAAQGMHHGGRIGTVGLHDLAGGVHHEHGRPGWLGRGGGGTREHAMKEKRGEQAERQQRIESGRE